MANSKNPSFRWLNSLILMTITASMVWPTSPSCAAEVPASRAGDEPATASARASEDATQFTLKVRIGLEKGKVSGTTPVALLQAFPPKLSSTESEIAGQAVAFLLDSCKSEEEAISVLAETVPERAFPRFVQVFAEAPTRMRQAMVRSAAKRSESAAIALIVCGLMDADKDVRSTTTSALTAAEKAIPVDALLAACKTASPEEICRAFAHIGDKEAASALSAIKALAAHKDPAVRAKALEKVGQAGDVSLAYGLRRSLSHPSPLVRGSALRGLAALKQLTEEDLLAATPAKGDEVSLAVLGLLKPTNNATLRAVVDDAFAAPSWEARKQLAIAAMGRLGDPADIPKLVRCLKEDTVKEVRIAAAKALGTHAQLTDFAPLIDLAKGETEKEYDVRRAVGAALASSKKGLQAALASLKPGSSTEWQSLVSTLASQDPPDPEALAVVIKRQGPKESGWDGLADKCAKLAPAERHRLLAMILERGDGEGQAKAIKSLLAEGTHDARQVLRVTCAYPGVLPSRTVETKWNFVASGDQVIGWLDPVKANVWEVLQEALRSLKDPDLPAAEAALLKTALASTEHPEAEVRAGAVRVIARFALAANLKVVWKAMQDKESEVREAFAEALKGLAPGQAAPALQHLAADAEYRVRRGVARVAVGLGDDQMLPVLKKLLTDQDSDVRAAAIAGIAKYPAHSALFLDAALTLTSHENQVEVADALADLPPAVAASGLSTLAVRAKDDDLAVKAIEKLFALAEAGKMEKTQAATALRTILEGAPDPRKLVAACTLAALGDPGGLPALLAFPETKRSCRRCILTAEFGRGKEKQPPIAPELVNLLALVSFQSGYKSTGFYSTTYYFNVPLRMARSRARFGGGDRWPLDVQHTLSDLDPVLLALATYHDPRADAKLDEALRSTNANMRRSALWGLVLRDDCPRVEALLKDPDATVNSDSILALRLLGHRSSLGALASKMKGSVPAAMAAVEVGLAPTRESKADGPVGSRP